MRWSAMILAMVLLGAGCSDDEDMTGPAPLPSGVTGVVYGDSGDERSPTVAGAVVTFVPGDAARTAAHATTDATGHYELELSPGTYLVQVAHDDFETWQSAEELHVESQKMATHDVWLTPLDAGGTGMQGEVRRRLADGSAGDTLAGAVIWLTSREGAHYEVLADELGRYRVELPAGRYLYLVSQYGSESDDGGWLVVEDGAFTAVDFLLERISESAVLSGRVIDVAEADVERAGVGSVLLTFISKDGSINKSVITTRNEDYMVGPGNGLYRVGLPAGSYRVEVAHPDYQWHAFSLRFSASQTRTIQLSAN